MGPGTQYRVIGYLSLLMGLAFLVATVFLWKDAGQRQQRFVPVDGVVTVSHFFEGAAARNGKCGRAFDWKYTYNDSVYTADYIEEGVWVYDDCAVLKKLLEDHPVGRELAGFHSIDRPSRSFIYPSADRTLPFFVTFAGLVVLAGVAMLREYRGYGSAPVPRRYGRWYHLRATSSHGGLAQLWGWAALWTMISFPPGIHFQRKFELGPVDDGVIALVGFVALVIFIVGWMLSGTRASAYEDPVVAIDKSPVRCGEVLRVKIVQHFRAPVHVNSVRLGLECRYLIVSKQSREVVVATTSEVREIDSAFTAGGRLDVEIDIRAPADYEVENASHRGLYWLLLVRCDGARIADADVQFPIDVRLN